MLVLPKRMAPALRKRDTSGASCAATKPARSLVPASQRIPFTSIELLMLIGTPCSGPRFSFPATASCAMRA